MDVKLVGNGPVLLVDDNPDDLEIGRRVFLESKVKNQVVLLRNGKQVIDYMSEVKEGSAVSPSMVLLDINMPGLDGHAVLCNIRKEQVFHELPKIVMFTASNDPSDMERCQKAGADGYMVKPWGIDEYVAFVNSLVPETAPYMKS